MSDDVRDDESFWLNAGVDFAYRRWVNPAKLLLEHIYELGQAMVQYGPGAADDIAVAIESRNTKLIRHQLGDQPGGAALPSGV